MKAVVIENFGDAEELHLEDVPTPTPTDHEVQIQIKYASVNPVDWKIREGMLKNYFPHEFPLIPGWDASGIITSLGNDAEEKFKLGDEVFTYCRKPTVQWGTYAEYVCVEANHVALKPKKIDFAQAAAIPLVGLTAWQSLFDCAKLKKGEKILIQAGAGGVGSLAIELAKYSGATVYTTSREENHSYVKKLGADFVVDYHKQPFAQQIKNMVPEGLDVIFDTIGGKTLMQSLNLLKPQGRLISIVEHLDANLVKEKDIQFHYVFVRPNGEQLEQIAKLIDAGKIAAPHVEKMKLEDAGVAQDKNRAGHTKGKIVLKVR